MNVRRFVGLLPPFVAWRPALTMSLYNYFKRQSPVAREVFVPSTADTGPKLSAVDVASCNSLESTEKKEKN